MAEPSPSLEVLVVDDEPRALRNLEALLARHPAVGRSRLCSSGADAVATLRADPPDLVLLDVQMPEVDGFEVVRRVGPERMPPVVFVTAHDVFALRAFDAEAVDYLLKPVSEERFARALARARAQHAAREAAALSARLARLLAATSAGAPAVVPAEPTAAAPLVLQDGARTLVLPPDEIDWVAAEDYCVTIVAGARRHLIRMTLASLAGRLDPRRFVRVHRSALVNVDRVRDLRPGASGRLELALRNGDSVPVSRARVHALRALLGAGR